MLIGQQQCLLLDKAGFKNLMNHPRGGTPPDLDPIQIQYRFESHLSTNRIEYSRKWSSNRNIADRMRTMLVEWADQVILNLSKDTHVQVDAPNHHTYFVRFEAYDTFSLVSCANAFPYPLRYSVPDVAGSFGAFGRAHSNFKIK